MANDPRAQVIIDQIMAAGREVKPGADLPPPMDGDDMEALNFALKLFDRLLPMLVSAVIAEYKKQENK